MNSWEVIYLGVTLYCLPLLWLTFTLIGIRDTASATNLPKWWQLICVIGWLEIGLLGIGLVFPVIMAPALLLELFGAPISAQMISIAMLVLSYGSIPFAMVPLPKRRCASCA